MLTWVRRRFGAKTTARLEAPINVTPWEMHPSTPVRFAVYPWVATVIQG